MKLAFRIIQPKNSRLADYYRKFYFYRYADYEPEYLLKKTCLVYSGFTELDVYRGVELSDYVGPLNQGGVLIDDSSDIARIDKIVG